MSWFFPILLLTFSFTVPANALEPEFRCIAPKETAVRKDSDEKAKVAWKVWKYFSVEVLKYRGDWRRIRDFQGDEGWIHKKDLDPMPCVQVRGEYANLRKYPGGPVEWELLQGYGLRVFNRKGDWLEVSDLEDASGWIHVSTVWGDFGSE